MIVSYITKIIAEIVEALEEIPIIGEFVELIREKLMDILGLDGFDDFDFEDIGQDTSTMHSYANMQKNFFVLTQNIVANVESQYISNRLLQEEYQSNASILYFRKKKEDLKHLLNNDLFICYTPAQIRLSLQKILSKYSLLEITGSNGYRMLQKMANKKF